MVKKGWKLIIHKKTKHIFHFENINPKSLSVQQAVVIHTHYPGGLCQAYKGPPHSFLPTTIVWRMTEGSWLEVVQVSPLQTPSDHQQPSRKTNWNAALTSTVPKNVKRECPKCGNFTYHIFLKNSRPVTNREVTGCARSWVCVLGGGEECSFTQSNIRSVVRVSLGFPTFEIVIWEKSYHSKEICEEFQTC